MDQYCLLSFIPSCLGLFPRHSKLGRHFSNYAETSGKVKSMIRAQTMVFKAMITEIFWSGRQTPEILESTLFTQHQLPSTKIGPLQVNNKCES